MIFSGDVSEESVLRAQRIIEEAQIPQELIGFLYVQSVLLACRLCAEIQRESHDRSVAVASFVDQWILAVLKQELKRINEVFAKVAERSGYSWEAPWDSKYIDSLTADDLNNFYYTNRLP